MPEPSTAAPSPVPGPSGEQALLAELAAGEGSRALRARIVLLAADGLRTAEIARTLGVSRQTVATWRRRYAGAGLDGLDDHRHPGRPAALDEAEAVVRLLTAPPGERSSRALARRLGCSHTMVASIRRRWGLAGDAAAPPVLPLAPPLGPAEIWVVGLHHEAARTLLLVAARAPGSGPVSGELPDADGLSVVAGALTAVGTALDAAIRRAGRPAPPPSGADGDLGGWLAAARRAHPHARLHAVLLRPGPDRDGAGAGGGEPDRLCARAGVELHRLGRRTGPAAFLRAAFALDAARHAESSARVVLDLAATLAGEGGRSRFGAVRWIREPLPSPAGARPVRPAVQAPPGANQIDLGSFNECVVIETVRLEGSITRGEIAARTHLTQQSVSRIARSLIERGLLVEEGRRASGVGKPRGLVRLRDGAGHALGIHVDPRILTAVLVDLSGRIVVRRAEPIAAGDRPMAVVDQIVRLGEGVLAEGGPAARRGFLGTGVATPGPVDTVTGTVLDPPLMSALRDVPLLSLLEQRLTHPIVIEKDSSAAAVGERWIGRESRARDFVYLYLGTGVGAGLILNGDIYRGLTANAGEFGQLCAVSLGRLDATGRPEILPECNPATHLRDDRAPRPFLGHRMPPTVREAAQAIGHGTHALVDLLDIGLVVVGGPFFTGESAGVYLAEIERAVNAYPTARRLRHVRVERSVNSREAAAVGAASTIFHAAFRPRLHRG